MAINKVGLSARAYDRILISTKLSLALPSMVSTLQAAFPSETVQFYHRDKIAKVSHTIADLADEE